MKNNKLTIGIAVGVLIALGVWFLSSGKYNNPDELQNTAKKKQNIRNGQMNNQGIVVITGSGNDYTSAERYERVAELSDHLTDIERRALYDFLKGHDSGPFMNAAKNDIMNVLRNQQQPPSELTDVLLALYHDKSQSEVIRIYAIQHLRPWYRQQGQKDPRIREAFFEALDETDSGVAGTALLAMRYLSRDQDGFDAAEIGVKAIEMAENPAANVLNRVSAIQVASTLSGKTGDGTKFRVLADNETHTMIKVAAIAAIGQSGDQSQREYLTAIADQNKEPFRTAAISALKKLSGGMK